HEALRDGLRHDAARFDERTRADLDEREDRGADADLRAARERWAPRAELRAATGMRVVRELHSGRDAHVVLERRQRGDEAVRVDTDAMADRAAAADHGVVSHEAVV